MSADVNSPPPSANAPAHRHARVSQVARSLRPSLRDQHAVSAAPFRPDKCFAAPLHVAEAQPSDTIAGVIGLSHVPYIRFCCGMCL
ncbi:MAG: hypothetical protein U0703_24605 [Anaerolineae bacterium]